MDVPGCQAVKAYHMFNAAIGSSTDWQIIFPVVCPCVSGQLVSHEAQTGSSEARDLAVSSQCSVSPVQLVPLWGFVGTEESVCSSISRRLPLSEDLEEAQEPSLDLSHNSTKE
ncbi:hypothetical protein NDU88_003278 [Pleurodeles waltl]|uniref:Uncharacterized protein n=1 Tax=Pleurodeles waltl TaxID=8319 RepID=A0AAV7NG78_PLEWA|nr:hypothetical protein NDU88_003278 [Pleurodeles waltl]